MPPARAPHGVLRAAATLGCALLLAACAHVSAVQRGGIPLPRLPAAGERVLVELELGSVVGGHEIVVRAPDGRLIGSVSPHGLRWREPAGTYALPIPQSMLEAIVLDGRLHLRFSVEPAGGAPRPARADEVRGVRAVVLPE